LSGSLVAQQQERLAETTMPVQEISWEQQQEALQRLEAIPVFEPPDLSPLPETEVAEKPLFKVGKGGRLIPAEK
jgi:hypothetical protein